MSLDYLTIDFVKCFTFSGFSADQNPCVNVAALSFNTAKKFESAIIKMVQNGINCVMCTMEKHVSICGNHQTLDFRHCNVALLLCSWNVVEASTVVFNVHRSLERVYDVRINLHYVSFNRAIWRESFPCYSVRNWTFPLNFNGFSLLSLFLSFESRTKQIAFWKPWKRYHNRVRFASLKCIHMLNFHFN